MTNQCVHGQLARQCPLCEKDAEISGLRTALLEASLAAQRVSEAAMLALGHAHERSKREPSSGGLMECAVEPSPPHSHEGETPVVVAHLHSKADITLGAEYIWEPDKPHARTRIRVVEIGETLVCHEPLEGRHKGAKLWNDISRFIEACVPAVNRGGSLT